MNEWEQLRKDMAEGHLSKDEEKLIETLQTKYTAMEAELMQAKELQTQSGNTGGFINWLKSLLDRKFEEVDERAEYWNNKWPRNEITYSARWDNATRYKMDVRHMILNKSHVLRHTARQFTGSDDEKAIDILKFVKNNLVYVSDSYNYNQAEYWQHPEITAQKSTGDCEDGALLIASLMRLSGIPAYKLKVCAGWVKSGDGRGGHAYVIYLADDDEWYVLDWCYYGNESIDNFKKVPHKHNDKYQEIWWTFNDEYTWAQKSTKL